MYDWDTTTLGEDSAGCVVEVIQGGGPPDRSPVFVVDNHEAIYQHDEGEQDPKTGRFHTVEEIQTALDGLAKTSGVKLTNLAAPMIPVAMVSDEDGTRREGHVIEPSVFINAGLHAREWIAPECALLFLEELATSKDEDIVRLREEARVFVLVVANPEGLAWSHQNWNQSIIYRKNMENDVIKEATPSDDKARELISVRDGRYRRKNLRDKLGDVLADTRDALWGVDLNRNFSTSFAAGTCEVLEVFSGPSAASEPETSAIEAFLGGAFNADQPLLGALDVHSNAQKLLVTNNVPGAKPKYDTHVGRVSGEMQARMAAAGIVGRQADVSPGLPGSLRMHVAHAFQVPSMSLELPFRDKNLQTNFFVKDDEIDKIYQGMRLGALSLIDWATGPPYVSRVKIKLGDTEMYSAHVQSAGATQRTLIVDHDQKFTQPGQYKVEIQFNRPLHGIGKGAEAPPDPAVKWGSWDNPEKKPVVKLDGWGKTVWQNDTWSGTMDVDEDDLKTPPPPPAPPLPGGPGPVTGTVNAPVFRLSIHVSDPFGNKLDGNPETVVQWNGQWVHYEDENQDATNELGGKDWNHKFGGGE